MNIQDWYPSTLFVDIEVLKEANKKFNKEVEELKKQYQDATDAYENYKRRISNDNI